MTTQTTRTSSRVTDGLGRTLIIANPVAHSGQGEAATQFVERFLTSWAAESDGFEVRRTGASGDALVMASEAGGFDTVLALGGDGIIHEVANGLMRLPTERRPRMGVIPMGSGNDYARTLGMARNAPDEALRQLVSGAAHKVELGLVNGTHFVETLSFGLDAAIALDTTDKRANDTDQEGTELFVTSGIRVLSRASSGFPCTMTFDDGEPRRTCSIIFAFQVGPSYGAGFRVCPDADPTDGLIDVCRNVRMPSIPHLLALFGAARWGGHARSRVIEMSRIRRATLDFDEEPPCQVDGEKLTGTHFEIEVVPNALEVIFPA